MNSDLQPNAAAGRLPVVSQLLAAVAVAIAAIPGAAMALQFDRSVIADHGSIWQVVTGHWTHWSLSHLFWDVLAFAVLGCLCETSDRRRFLWCVAASIPTIPAVLWFTEPWMQTYRGLSGIDSALFALFVSGLMKNAAREGGRVVLVMGTTLFTAFAGKLAFEFLAGQTVFVDSASAGMVPVPMAHVVGMVVGVACGTAGTFDSQCSQFQGEDTRPDVPAVKRHHRPHSGAFLMPPALPVVMTHDEYALVTMWTRDSQFLVVTAISQFDWRSRFDATEE